VRQKLWLQHNGVPAHDEEDVPAVRKCDEIKPHIVNHSVSFSGYFTTLSVSPNIMPNVRITVAFDEWERTRKSVGLT
jgi:hypothetical protein